jgi:hypothetical protein
MLGPLEVRAGSDELLEVGGARLRTLLIMLRRIRRPRSTRPEEAASRPSGCGS